MKTKFFKIFFLLILSGVTSAQQFNFALANAGVIQVGGSNFIFGLKENDTQTLQFYVYRLNSTLTKEDSLNIDLGKKKADNFLTISADSLHGFLNFYLQEKGSKVVTILRTTKNFSPPEKTENADIARLNNSAIFNKEHFYAGEMVYDVRKIKDSSGVQFYLNKYQLKSKQGNFDYLFQWQFPLDKKDITEVKIISADKNLIMAYVWRQTSEGTSQWLIRVNANSGQLQKAVRVSEKGDPAVYYYGTHIVEKGSRNLFLLGQKRSEKPGAPPALWVLKLDSIGELISRKDFNLSLTEVTASPQKKSGPVLFNFRKISRSVSTINLDLDLYAETNGCYAYRGTQEFALSELMDEWSLEQSKIQFNKDIDYFFSTPDKSDMNGKFCPEKESSFESHHYHVIEMPARLAANKDPAGQNQWLLFKNEVKKNQISYYYLKMENKKYASILIQKLNKNLQPGILVKDEHRFYIYQQSDAVNFQIQIFNW